LLGLQLHLHIGVSVIVAVLRHALGKEEATRSC